jgi:hypothetical protein
MRRPGLPPEEAAPRPGGASRVCRGNPDRDFSRVREAQDEIGQLQGKHGAINPTWNDQDDLAEHVQVVKFDVAVTAGDQATKGRRAGIKVWSIEVSGKLEEQMQNKTVSRISFAVPILSSTMIVQGAKKPTKRQGRVK